MNDINQFSSYFKAIPMPEMVYRNYSHILVETEKLFAIYLKSRSSSDFERFIANYKLLGLNSSDCLEFMKVRKHDFLLEGYIIPTIVAVNDSTKIQVAKRMRTPYYLKNNNNMTEFAFGHRICLLHRRSEDCTNCGEKTRSLCDASRRRYKTFLRID